MGTLVFDAQTNILLGELLQPNETLCVAKGGFRGLGNTRFKSSTQQAPRKTTPGKPGEYRKLRLELKLLANVGLLGLPNAGKSSFLAAISRATPKIANYPFTTLHPQLGVVSLEKGESLVVADLPGLIKGASEGAGLGHRFLKHLQRNAVLAHLIDGSQSCEKLLEDIHTIESELQTFDPKLLQKPRILLINKIDLLATEEREERQQALKNQPLTYLLCSAQTTEGLEAVIQQLQGLCQT